MVWLGLVWSGLVWLGSVWSGLVWSGAVWSGGDCWTSCRAGARPPVHLSEQLLNRRFEGNGLSRQACDVLQRGRQRPPPGPSQPGREDTRVSVMVTQGARRGGRGRQGLGGPRVAPGGPRAAATPELNLSEPSLTRGGQRPGTEGGGCPAHLRSLRRGWTWGVPGAGVSPGLLPGARRHPQGDAQRAQQLLQPHFTRRNSTIWI